MVHALTQPWPGHQVLEEKDRGPSEQCTAVVKGAEFGDAVLAHRLCDPEQITGDLFASVISSAKWS